jgi:hypothetical protein
MLKDSFSAPTIQGGRRRQLPCSEQLYIRFFRLSACFKGGDRTLFPVNEQGHDYRDRQHRFVAVIACFPKFLDGGICPASATSIYYDVWVRLFSMFLALSSTSRSLKVSTLAVLVTPKFGGMTPSKDPASWLMSGRNVQSAM